MEYTCSNCNSTIHENFCSKCGQKKYKRIDRKYISDELQYSLLHTNKGFFYSIKKISKNPGKTAREFIDGNRVNHYKPILLVLLLSGISAFVSFKILGMDKTMTGYYKSMGITEEATTNMISFLATYNSFIMLLLVPIFAAFTKLAFYKWGHNYFEHVIMNAFILAFYTIFTLVVISPILYFLKDDPHTSASVIGFALLATPVLLVWFFKGFYPGKSLKVVVLRVLLTLLFMAAAYLLLIIIATIIVVAFRPDILKSAAAMKAQ